MSDGPAPRSPQPPPVTGRHASWRSQPGRWGWPTGRRLRRALVTLLAMGLIVALAVLLVEPFLHPRTHLMVVRGPQQRLDQFETTSFPPAQPYVNEDCAALEPLARVLAGRESEQKIRQLTFDAPEDIHALHQQIDELGTGRRDVLIVYVIGQGIAHKAVPFLAFPVDPQSGTSNRVALREMLNQFAESAAGLKLLVVSAGSGRLASSTSAVNEFPRLLREAVEATGDPSLWVLLSHATGEQSHSAHALQQSVFGAFVSRGLLGAADLDGDQTVNLDELFRFVAANVSDWVRQTTGGSVAQHPQLFWGGGTANARMARAATLVPVPAGKTAAGKTAASHDRALAAVPPTAAVPAKAGTLTKIPVAQPPLPTKLIPITAVNKASLPVAKMKSPAPAAAKSSPTTAKPAPAATEPQTAKTPDNKTSAADAAEEESSKPSSGAEKTPPKPSDTAAKTQPKPSGGAEAGSVPAPSTAQSPADLLEQAWRLRDELESAESREGPIVYAPHLWRAFQEQLLTLEWTARTTVQAGDSSKDETALPPLLRHTVNGLAALQAGSQELSADAPQLLHQIHAARPRIAIDATRLHALGMAERLVHPLPANIAQTLQQFDALLKTGSRQDFQKWSQKLPSEQSQFSEIQLALALVPLVDVEWETLRRALQLRRLAERVAANPWTTDPPYRDTIDRADRFRRAGERILLDRIERDRGPASRQQLEEANRLYRQVLADVIELESIARLQRELTFRAPWYVAWYRAAGTGAGAPETADLLSLLKTLRTLTTELYDTDSANLTNLRRLAVRLRSLQAAVEVGMAPPTVAALIGPPVDSEDGWRIESLLVTPLPPSAARVELLNRVEAIHATVAEDVKRPVIPDLVPTSRPLALVDWQRVKQVVNLERELLRLAVDPLPDGGDAVGKIETEYARVRTLFDPPTAGAAFHASNALHALRDFEDALENAYRELAIWIGKDLNASTGTLEPKISVRIQRLRAALHALRVCDDEEIDLSNLPEPASDLHRLYWLKLAHQQRERALAAREDAPQSELARLTATAAEYQKLVQQLSEPDGEIVNDFPSADLSGPSSLSLVIEDRAELNIAIRSFESVPTPAWIVLDYDPQLLTVEPTGRQTLYRRDLLRDELQNRLLEETAGTLPARAAEYPLRPDLASLPSTLTIPASDPAVLPLAVRKVPGAAGPARLIVKTVAGGQVVRHEVEVELPLTESLEVRITGIPNSSSHTSSSDAADGRRSVETLALHPFPNRTTDYQLSLANTGPEPRNVAVELFALPSPIDNADSHDLSSLPSGGLPAADANRILDELDLQAPLVSVPKLALPATGEAVPIPFPKLPAKGGGKPAGSPADANSETANSTTAAAGASAAPTGPPPMVAAIDDGMLLVVRDTPSKRVLLKPIRVLPQHPQRFLRVETGYDLRRQRVEVTVTPEDPARLPPGGVHVRCEFAQPLPSDAEQRLEALLAAPKYEAQLYAVVPTRPGRVETIFISVDGFPRAFVYRVDCGMDRENISEVTDRLSVRLTSPSQGTAYSSPRESIPVGLQVDAPPGAFGTSEDFVEIGIDVDQDGEFRNESPLRLRSDRQVEVALAGTTPTGGLAIATRIGDFSLSLPALGMQNQHVNLLARVHAGGRSLWSQAVEVVFDGMPPRVDQIRLNPALHATLGKPVTVLVEASDAELSGVKSVETAFDAQHTGSFGTQPPPVPAARNDQGQWRAVLDTSSLKPGAYSVLVRATDRVGNVSETAHARIEIITPEAAAAMRKAAAVTRISGLVQFGEQPAPGIEITLKAVKPKEDATKTKDEQLPKFAPVQTDDSGAFEFTPVPPGKYTLTASGVIYNKTRTTTIELTVPPTPKPEMNVELRLE